ncbi:RNA helicase [Fasciola hepatica]|uniref:ATP-dependent RNA helicase n=1 Tax=Fasciola hepatica TaxID=6192 RepID=A0A4E0RL79_FASHE|nr:RNA helicase [Fasciola hepatica]
MEDFVINITSASDRKVIRNLSVDGIRYSRENSNSPANVVPTVLAKTMHDRRRSDKIAKNDLTRGQNRVDPGNRTVCPPATSGSLQFSYDKTADRAREVAVAAASIPDLMRVRVNPVIEPIFSSKNWRKLCSVVGVHPHIIGCLSEKFKISRLTAIQEATFMPLMEGRNALVRAQTGSGKTLAYAVPLLTKLINVEPPVSRCNGPLALVVLPTRELATQTYEVFQVLCKSCVRIVPGLLIGGTRRKTQKASLRKGINIVIGTPQRILDHILRTASLDLSRLQWLVIDEADRLLEMGFERDVRRILEHIKDLDLRNEQMSESKGDIQTVLLSATLTSGVEKLAGLTLTNPVQCLARGPLSSPNGTNLGTETTISSTDVDRDQFAMPSGLRHFILVVPWKLRLVSLAAFILLKCQYHKNGGKLVVFMATQDCVDFHYRLFKTVLCPDDEEYLIPAHASRLSLFRLHGSMEHSDRESVFRTYSLSKSGILLTTDVASRGLDLASVSWVVMYHVTGGAVDYVHRVGRTARAGGHGKAVLFLNSDELGYVDVVRAVAGVNFEQLSLPDLLQTSLYHICNTKPRGDNKAPSCSTVEESTSRFSNLFVDAVTEDLVLNPLAETAYTSFLRAYASFSGELRQFFTFKRLHLGHVARAFGLMATPKAIASRVTGRIRGLKQGKRLAKSGSQKRQPDEDDSEIAKHLAPKRRPEVMGFDRPLPKNNVKVIKPVDIARRNMLAEYGL